MTSKPEGIAALHAERWEPTTRNHDPAHLTFARDCYAAGFLAAMAECESRLERAMAVYDACREALEAEYHRASLAEMERDAILRWSIRHAGYLGTREDTDGEGRWWARGDEGRVMADTAETVVRKAAGLEPEPASWDDE